jgi:hypothetical protein
MPKNGTYLALKPNFGNDKYQQYIANTPYFYGKDSSSFCAGLFIIGSDG